MRSHNTKHFKIQTDPNLTVTEKYFATHITKQRGVTQEPKHVKNHRHHMCVKVTIQNIV